MTVPPRKKAIALKYSLGDHAPTIVASGAGEVAKRILALAEEHNVPIREGESVVECLAKIPVGYEIPQETFAAVAEIIAFLFRLETDSRAVENAALRKPK